MADELDQTTLDNPSKKPKYRKRGQGEGTIYKRKDGRWAAAVTLGYQGGKFKRKTVYGKTRKEVQDKLTIELRKVQQGLPIVNERHTLAQFLKSWLESVAKPSVRPKTYRTYSDLVKLHLEPALGNQPLAKLSPQRIQTFLNDKSKSGLAPKTVRHIHSTLRAALNIALRWGLVARNVATLVSPPRLQAKEIKPMSQGEIKAFLNTIKGDRLECLFLIAFSLGLRRGELLGLRWQDIDLEARTLRVSLALQRVSGKLELSEPKTDRSRRALPLTDGLISALRTHRARQREERLLAGPKWKENGFVFSSSIGTPLEPRNLIRKFQAILKKANLGHYRFHDLRHSCATMLIAQGAPARTVMDILGHSQISLTMNTYGHIMLETRREAIELLDAVLTGGK
jgi:integrase